MHIAIEGMDGVGKTSQAKAVARKIGGEFIAKSFHEMNDTSGKYDSFVTIDQFTEGEVAGIYGLRQNYFNKKLNNEDVVTDRFYVSNYWSRADELSIKYFKKISDVWGIPDLIIILYAEPEILYKRIYNRNSSDKDLWKPQVAKKAYDLMLHFVKEMKLSTIVIDNSTLSFEETTEVILFAKESGIHKCKEKYGDLCKIITPNTRKLQNQSGTFEIADNILISCQSDRKTIYLPDEVEEIREKAFEKCTFAESVYLPKTVKLISTFAFLNSKIASIGVARENPFFCDVEGILYDKARKTLIKYPFQLNKKITILEGVEKIGNCAFHSCTSIEHVILPQSIKEISYGAFVNCRALKKIEIEDNQLGKISSGAFYGCDQLKSIVLANENKYYTADDCLKDDKGNILFYFGELEKGKLYKVPKAEYIYPFAYHNRLRVDQIEINQRKVGAYAFEACHVNKVEIKEKVEDLGERCFWKAGVEFVKLKARKIPEIWNNSFDLETSYIVEGSKQREYWKSHEWQNKNLWSEVGEKDERSVCGTACLQFIVSKEKKEEVVTITKNYYWIMEMGDFLIINLSYSAMLIYSESRLMKDYFNHTLPKEERVHHYIERFIAHGGMFKEQKITINDLKEKLEEYRWIILCLKSEILFNDKKLAKNNHFVILESIEEQAVRIISPGVHKFYCVYLSSDKLIEAIQENGQWLLCVGDQVGRD